MNFINNIINIINNYCCFFYIVDKNDVPNEWKFITTIDNQFTKYHKLYIPSMDFELYFSNNNILNISVNNDLIFYLEFLMFNIILYRNYIYYKNNNDTLLNYIIYNSKYTNSKNKLDCLNHILWYRNNFKKINILINKYSSYINISLYNYFYYLPISNNQYYYYKLNDNDDNRIRNKDIQIFIQSLNYYYKYDFSSMFKEFIKIFNIQDLSSLNFIFNVYNINFIYNKVNKFTSYKDLEKIKFFVKINNNFNNFKFKDFKCFNLLSKNLIYLNKRNLLIDKIF